MDQADSCGDGKKRLDSRNILNVEPIGFPARLDKDCERERVKGFFFILISCNMENMANRKKRVDDNKYKHLFWAVLVKREAKKWHANHRRHGPGGHCFPWEK